MDKQCPVDGCENILRQPIEMNKLCRVDNNTKYICAECGNAQALPWGVHERKSARAYDALQGHGWSYDLRAIAKEADETGGLEVWAGDEVHHELNVISPVGVRALYMFGNMHHPEDIVGAVYTHGEDEYLEEKAAKIREHGFLYWAGVDLDISNMQRLVHLVNLYAHNFRG